MGAVNDCINQKCNETLVIPSTENQSITFQPCDVCTQCPTSKPRTIQAWWYYFYPNGVEAGNTIIVIEHNLEVIKTADWIIDLGPEGGGGGGRIVAAGTPEQVADAPGSHTGRYLADYLRRTDRLAG